MNSSEDIDRTLADATELGNRSDFAAALTLLEPLTVSEPNNPRVLGVLAGVYFRQGRLEEAGLYFRKATVLSPKSELASLGLFHALWETGARASAELELTRFLRLRESEEYRLLLEEMGWRFEDGALVKPP